MPKLLLALVLLLQTTSVAVVYLHDGGAIYHREHCIGLPGKPLRAVKIRDLGAGVEPCSMCKPPTRPPLPEPTAVFVVTGSNATGLYHRQGCAALKGGGLSVLTLNEAKARHFQPHCLCIVGTNGTAPCEPAPTTAATSAAKTAAAPRASTVVYITRTGENYHRSGCRSLAKSRIEATLGEAVKRYGACAICRPPTLASDSTPTSASTPRSTQCAATTQKGTRCSRRAQAGSAYCWQHGR
jgi:hypothetical protein